MSDEVHKKMLSEVDRLLGIDSIRRREDGIKKLADILANDPAAHILNTRELAFRLWVRGVRV